MFPNIVSTIKRTYAQINSIFFETRVNFNEERINYIDNDGSEHFINTNDEFYYVSLAIIENTNLNLWFWNVTTGFYHYRNTKERKIGVGKTFVAFEFFPTLSTCRGNHSL